MGKSVKGTPWGDLCEFKITYQRLLEFYEDYLFQLKLDKDTPGNILSAMSREVDLYKGRLDNVLSKMAEAQLMQAA